MRVSFTISLNSIKLLKTFFHLATHIRIAIFIHIQNEYSKRSAHTQAHSTPERPTLHMYVSFVGCSSSHHLMVKCRIPNIYILGHFGSFFNIQKNKKPSFFQNTQSPYKNDLHLFFSVKKTPFTVIPRDLRD